MTLFVSIGHSHQINRLTMIKRLRCNHPRSETCFASFPNVPSLKKEGNEQFATRLVPPIFIKVPFCVNDSLIHIVFQFTDFLSSFLTRQIFIVPGRPDPFFIIIPDICYFQIQPGRPMHISIPWRVSIKRIAVTRITRVKRSISSKGNNNMGPSIRSSPFTEMLRGCTCDKSK